MMKNRLVLISLVIIILILGCTKIKQPTDKVNLTVSSYETDKLEIKQSKQKINPPEPLTFSEEIKEYTSKYCEVALEDMKIDVASVEKAEESKATSSMGGEKIQPFMSTYTPSKSVVMIDTVLVKNILKKLPISKLDSSITIGITTRTESGFKNFYAYVNNGEPVVKEQAFDFDDTKVVLTIPEDEILLKLSETSSNDICAKFKTEINNKNIEYDVHFKITDSFKSGVSDLKSCLQ